MMRSYSHFSLSFFLSIYFFFLLLSSFKFHFIKYLLDYDAHLISWNVTKWTPYYCCAYMCRHFLISVQTSSLYVLYIHEHIVIKSCCCCCCHTTYFIRNFHLSLCSDTAPQCRDSAQCTPRHNIFLRVARTRRDS